MKRNPTNQRQGVGYQWKEMLTIDGLLKARIKLQLKLMVLPLHKQYASTPT